VKKSQELTVLTKTYDLIVWTVNHTSRFPRNHRHVLGVRIEQHLYDVLELLIEAKFSRQRRGQLEQLQRSHRPAEFPAQTASGDGDLCSCAVTSATARSCSWMARLVRVQPAAWVSRLRSW
jgi:hypothetical protein